MKTRILQLVSAAALFWLPFGAAAHLLDGSPDPLPRWVSIAGLIIAGTMGGAVGFAISRHRQSLEQKKKQRQQRAAAGDAESSSAGSLPPQSGS